VLTQTVDKTRKGYGPHINPAGTWHCCDRKAGAASAQSFTLWQQATIEFTCHDHSPRTLVVTFNRSPVNIGRASTPQSLYYRLFAPHICTVLFFTHIPFVGNRTINATPPERLQHCFSLSQTSKPVNESKLQNCFFRKFACLVNTCCAISQVQIASRTLR